MTRTRFAWTLATLAVACASPPEPDAAILLGHEGAVVARFSPTADLSFGARHWTIGVESIERGSITVTTPPVSSPARAGADAVQIARGGGVIESWEARAEGLEHGATLDERVGGDGELVVNVAVRGELRPRALAGDVVDLVDASGAVVSRYGDLVVADARHARVDARMEVRGANIALVIDDHEAEYPLVIDPLLTSQEAVLVGPLIMTGDATGSSVAISGDGTRAIVGAPNDMVAAVSNVGSARVFVRNGANWVHETTLTPESIANARAGTSVAITQDGSRVFIGAPGGGMNPAGGCGQTGAVWAYDRSGTTWGLAFSTTRVTTQYITNMGATLAVSRTGGVIAAGYEDYGNSCTNLPGWSVAHVPSTGMAATQVGSSVGQHVAVSGDGSRIFVGSPFANRVYVYQGAFFMLEAMFSAPDSASGDALGSALAASDDGSRVFATAPGDDVGVMNAGSVRVFLRTGTSWAYEAMLSVGSGMTNDALESVASSADGALVIAGTEHEASAAGRAHLFVRTGTTWAEDASLAAPDAAAGDHFGRVVSLTADGSRAVIGVPDDGGGGSARVFVIGWRPQGAACQFDAECHSGFCTDGVCCNARCGGNVTADCQACSAALTGGADGICGALSASVAPTITCGPATGACDITDTCIAGNTVCPDAVRTSSTVCRASAGACDVSESCDGVSPSCPPDAHEPSGFVCRASMGECDPAEVCDGSSSTCPGDVTRPVGSPCGTAATACTTGGTCNASGACAGGTFRPVNTVCLAAAPGNPCDVNDVCSGTDDICRPLYAPATTACGNVASDVCDAPDHCAGNAPTCLDALQPTSFVCRAAAGTCDDVERCDGANTACPADTFQPSGFLCRAATGPCDQAEVCGGTTAACPSDQFLASDTICRFASDVCDLAEYCSGASGGCPSNTFAPSSAVCRASVGTCDVAETCSGIGASCPADVIVSAGTSCRAAVAGGCDIAELCDGVSGVCPMDAVQPMATVCRATRGACDPTEACDGTSPACPADVISAAGTGCGSGAASCATAGTCDGAGVSCPGATPRPNGYICNLADPTNPCDVDDVCDGINDVCRPRFAMAGTLCRPPMAGGCDVAEMCTGIGGTCPIDSFALAGTVCNPNVIGVCDAPDLCPGTSATCMPTFISGVVCRAAAGGCDVAEACSGTAASCPPDALLASGVTCRASTAACDPAESCDGTATSCPPDVSSCMNMPDTGMAIDAASTSDGGAAHDASSPIDVGAHDAAQADGSMSVTPPPNGGGCGCAAERSRMSATWLVLGLSAMLMMRRRRR